MAAAAAAAAKTVCVTGGSGFIASWLIKDLLRRGYTVNATVRFPNDPKKTDHLVSLEGAKERLKLMKADLMEEGSFDAAIAGCQGVFHCASPFFLHHTPHPQTYPNVAYGWVHVRDVVEAHILAFEKGEANGRYYVAERSANPPQLINILAQLFPNLNFPTRCADEKPLAPAYKVNNERAKELGVSITPLEVALKETVESLKKKGFLKA